MHRVRPMGRRPATIVPTLALALATVAALLPAAAAPVAAANVTVTVTATDLGAAPEWGYNLAHFAEGSNAADWWAYSGARHARAFISPSDIEPSDDLAPVGDGVATLADFRARRSLVRAATVASGTGDATYVRWSAFVGRYRTADGDTNRFTIDHAFPVLRDRGVAILANITASPSRFPIASDADWAGKWELWQHYYAQAYLLASRYGVVRYGMFNEPNNWNGMTPTDWLRRLLVAADAIRAGVADSATRNGGPAEARIHAPGTANGASKYADWGRPAVIGRHDRWDGATDPDWSNLDIYAYQKYSMNATGTATAYGEDADTLRGYIAADMPGVTPFPLALTEMNVRTGSDYDGTSATLDTPADFTQLAANAITVARRGVRHVYLFKFGQSERTGGTYPVAKNGTHYVENASGSGNDYGGATLGAEVWRQVVAACGPGRRMLNASTTLSGLVTLACRPADGGALDLIVANTTTSSHSVTLDLAPTGLPSNANVLVHEVSTRNAGGVQLTGRLGSKRTFSAGTMPAQSVWRVRVSASAGSTATVVSVADATLADGSGRTTPRGTEGSLDVRADGTVNGRRVALIRIPVSAQTAAADRVLLALRAANASRSGTYSAHVYGLDIPSWSESGTTWSALAGVLGQSVPAGTTIAANVVQGQGATATILGRLLTASTSFAWRHLDVTAYVRSRAAAGYAHFLVVQDHRWDVAIPELTVGDRQADGIRISSREAGSSSAPRLLAISGTVTLAGAPRRTALDLDVTRARVPWGRAVRVDIGVRSGRWVPAGTVRVHTGTPGGRVVGRCRPDLLGRCSLRVRGLSVATQPLVAVFSPARGFRPSRAEARVTVVRPAWMEPATVTLAAGPADGSRYVVTVTLAAPDTCRADRAVRLVRAADGVDAAPHLLATGRTDAAGRATLVVPADAAQAPGDVRAEVGPDGRCEGPVTAWGPMPVGVAPGAGSQTDDAPADVAAG